MQVINKQQNGIKHEYMLHFCNCMQATYLLFFYQKLLDWFTFSPKINHFVYIVPVIFSINTS